MVSSGRESHSPFWGVRRTLHFVTDSGKAGGPQQPCDLVIRFIEHMSLAWELLLGHRRHVLPQLVAERKQPSRPDKATDQHQLVRGLVPEVEDMIGDDSVDGRCLGQRRDAALHQRQATGPDLSRVTLPGLRQHFRRGVDAPDSRAAEPPQRLLETDTRPRPQLSDPPKVVLIVFADLLHHPAAELGVGASHAVPDQPAKQAMRACELPGDDRHLVPPMLPLQRLTRSRRQPRHNWPRHDQTLRRASRYRSCHQRPQARIFAYGDRCAHAGYAGARTSFHSRTYQFRTTPCSTKGSPSANWLAASRVVKIAIEPSRWGSANVPSMSRSPRAWKSSYRTL